MKKNLKISIKSTKEGLNYSLKCDQKFEINQFTTTNSSFEVSENLLPTLYKFLLESAKNVQCQVCPFCDAKFDLFVHNFEHMATHATKLKQKGIILNRTNTSPGGISHRTNPSEGGNLNRTKCSSDSSTDEVRPPAKKRKMIRMVSDSESDIEIIEKSNDIIQVLENSNDTEVNFIGSISKKDSGKHNTDSYSSESESDSVYCFDERTLQVLNSTVIDSAESSDARTFFNRQAISNSEVQANPEGEILNQTYQIHGEILNQIEESSERIEDKTTKLKSKNCEICGKNFNSHRNLKQHKENIHEGKKRFSCGLCDKRFSQNKYLIMHNAKIHEKKIDNQCPGCNKNFATKHGLKKHTEVVHDKKKSFICDKCEKAFGAKLTLQRHKINCNRLLIIQN